jgi:hypothetical protein
MSDTWLKKQNIGKRQKDIPNPKLKYSMIRIHELVKLYNEIYLLRNKVKLLLDEKNKLISFLKKFSLRHVGILKNCEQIINKEKEKILLDFINKKKKIINKFKNDKLKRKEKKRKEKKRKEKKRKKIINKFKN